MPSIASSRSPKPDQDASLLIVDDEPDTLLSLKSLLGFEFPQLRIVLETDPVRAAGHLDDPALRLILADYRMPRQNGVELLKAAQKAAPQAKRVLITAFPIQALEEVQGLEETVDALLLKPLTTRPFVEQIAAFLQET